nr:unnamed protein product [Callosobruchus analis]
MVIVKLKKLLFLIGKLLQSEHSGNHHGFRGKRSTTALKDLAEFVYNCLHNKELPSIISFDLSRAFDTVDHQLLLVKLNHMGIRGISNKWIESYLQGRQQVTVVNESKSHPRNVDIGIPQGSALGPILFVVFMNDIRNCLETNCFVVQYADDTNIGMSYESECNTLSHLNRCAENFYKYCVSNGLKVNIDKTVHIPFRVKNSKQLQNHAVLICDKEVPNVDHHKFLGVTLDSKLTWEHHINDITSKLSKAVYLIRRLKTLTSADILRLSYFGLVQSVIANNLILWGNSAHASKVFIIQKKIIRIMAGVHPLYPCRELFKKLGILTVPSLYIYLTVVDLMKSSDYPQMRNSEVHSHNTRNNRKIYQPYYRLQICQNSVKYKQIMFYNRLVDILGEPNDRSSFKKCLYSYLGNMAFYSENHLYLLVFRVICCTYLLYDVCFLPILVVYFKD